MKHRGCNNKNESEGNQMLIGDHLLITMTIDEKNDKQWLN